MKTILINWLFRIVFTTIVVLISHYIFKQQVSFIDVILLNGILTILTNETED